MSGCTDEHAMIELRNGRVSLALHTLQEGQGAPLLLLHALGGSAEDFRARQLPWSGPVHALDFCGHGYSGRLHGGGYYPELWAADADAALAKLGSAVVLGVGLGAYVALLIAGGRAESVRCAVLCPGEGLEGGGAEPDFAEPDMPDVPSPPPARALQSRPSTEPNATLGQTVIVRPPIYAARFAAAARRVLLVEDGTPRPPWWQALAGIPSVQACADASDGLRAASRQSVLAG